MLPTKLQLSPTRPKRVRDVPATAPANRRCCAAVESYQRIYQRLSANCDTSAQANCTRARVPNVSRPCRKQSLAALPQASGQLYGLEKTIAVLIKSVQTKTIRDRSWKVRGICAAHARAKRLYLMRWG